MTQLVRWLAGLAAALVLVQAALAGQWLAGNAAIIETHGWLGNGTFLLTILLAGVSLLGWRQGRFDLKPFVVSVVMVLLIAAQLGLGYVGRSSAAAASIHLPLGVLIFGALLALLALMMPTRLATAPARAR
jgi:hypothetical protein